jgi:hypothetical protein
MSPDALRRAVMRFSIDDATEERGLAIHRNRYLNNLHVLIMDSRTLRCSEGLGQHDFAPDLVCALCASVVRRCDK